MGAPGETREQITELHRLSAAHSDATIDELPLDAPGVVPWWPEERKHVTLQQILVHMCVETAHHLGHADILRELIDGPPASVPGTRTFRRGPPKNGPCTGPASRRRPSLPKQGRQAVSTAAGTGR